MAIDWEAGEITDDPHIMWPDQIKPVVENMYDGEVGYVLIDALCIDARRTLWINPGAVVYDHEAAEIFVDEGVHDLCRIIATDKGPIVDVSDNPDALDPQSKDSIPVDMAADLLKEGWRHAAGLIEDDEQRDRAGMIMYQRYGLMLGRSALAAGPVLESPDDSAELGDDGLIA